LILLFSAIFGAVAYASTVSSDQNETPTVLVVVGAPGEKEYGQNFESWAKLWEKDCQIAGAQFTGIGLSDPGTTNDVDRLAAVLESEPKETTRELWLVFIGHGTFDGKDAKFNLRGPDLSCTNLANWLLPFHRPIVLIDCTSASAPFLNKLSAPGRVIVTATRSGYEQNYARFGQYFSEAIADPKADLDKDGQVSILEAFLMASHGVSEFYKTAGRLATEHPLLDDSGDGLGTPPDWFRGIRAVKKPAQGSSVDGPRAHQFHLIRSDAERKLSPALRAKRNEVELSIEDLRQSKETLGEDDYYRRLEPLLLELARLYQSAESENN
jgi:hypothetical protein